MTGDCVPPCEGIQLRLFPESVVHEPWQRAGPLDAAGVNHYAALVLFSIGQLEPDDRRLVLDRALEWCVDFGAGPGISIVSVLGDQ